jgi:Ca-activated chloride channel family protein
MNDADKIGKARDAALAFLDKVESQNRVGLIVFSSEVQVLVPLDTLERNKAALKEQISGLSATGGTALFDALQKTMAQFPPEGSSDRIQAIVMLTDGQDTDSQNATKNGVISQIEASRANANPLVVIPIAYGSDADIGTLNAIARASGTNMQSGDQDTIRHILDIISSFF